MLLFYILYKPVIELNGDSVVTIDVGSEYVEMVADAYIFKKSILLTK